MAMIDKMVRGMEEVDGLGYRREEKRREVRLQERSRLEPLLNRTNGKRS
jgi:hypothetical protein